MAPLLVAAPAGALIPKADLKVVKTVASNRPTITLNPALSSTGANGHLEWVDSGLNLLTDAQGGAARRIVEYVDTSTPLSTAVSAPLTLTYVQAANTDAPLPLLQVDHTGDGVADIILALTSTTTWTGYVVSNGAPANLLAGNTTNTGTPATWAASLPQNALVTAFGFGFPGPNANANTRLTMIDFAGMHYDLARVFQSGITAAPGETVSYKLVVANGSGANTKTAQGVQVADVLPPDMTYVNGSLALGGTTGACDFANNMLTCAATSLPSGQSGTITFQATLDEDISTAGLPQTEGHWVDVKHNATTTVLNVGQTRTINAMCPEDYMATDGGLLLDQAGDDVVTESSVEQANNDGLDGWQVRASNLGAATDVTVEVTCLAVEVGSSGGHTHYVDAQTLPMQQKIAPNAQATYGKPVQRSCPTGYTPYAPEFDTTANSGIAVIRESYAVDNTWYWVVDHEDGTDASFGISCLAPQTLSDSGHTADLAISTPDDTISVGAENQTEGIMTCPADSNAIVGGYGGYTSQVRSLGAEPRGDTYMFRFYNADPDTARNADIQVTCIGSLTTDEPTYKDVINTAYVTTTTKDRDSTDNHSSATVAVNGDPVAGQPSGVILNTYTAIRTVANNKTTAINLNMRCTKTNPCNFTVKAFSGTNLVANKTTTILGNTTKNVTIPTTSLGKNLAFGDNIVVKIKTTLGTTTYNVGII